MVHAEADKEVVKGVTRWMRWTSTWTADMEHHSFITPPQAEQMVEQMHQAWEEDSDAA